MIVLCAICANERDGAVRPFDGRALAICDVCENEHPRAGRIHFEDAPITGRVAGFSAKALGWGGPGFGHRKMGGGR